jgi:hypothetical protein
VPAKQQGGTKRGRHAALQNDDKLRFFPDDGALYLR